MNIVNQRMERRLKEHMALDNLLSKRYFAALDSLKDKDGLVLCLQLKNCQIHDERLSELLAMECSETITSIDLADNLITDDGILFLTKRLRGGAIPSLLSLDVRGNPITSRAYDLLDEIRHVRKILKIYDDSDISNAGGHIPELDKEVGTERALNLYRSKWSAACTDNGDNWLLSKPRLCDQSVFTLKDKVQSAIKVLNDRTSDSLRLAAILKEITLLVPQDVSLQWQNGFPRPIEAEYSEGVKVLVCNFRSLISVLDMNSSKGNTGDQVAGVHRIALVELLYTVILHCFSLVEEDILSSGVLAKLLKLFVDFPHNSVLHCAVLRCLQAILLRSSTTLVWCLVKDACLPCFLAKEGIKCSALLQGRRPSYSGHIYSLSKVLNEVEENVEGLKEFLTENMDWQLYVGPNGPFRKMQVDQSGDLCGPKPVLPRLVTNFLQNPARNLVQVNQFTA